MKKNKKDLTKEAAELKALEDSKLDLGGETTESVESTDSDDDVVGDDDTNTSDDYAERHDFVTDPKQSLIRLDKFVVDRLAGRSRNKIQNAIKAGAVKVDDKEVKPNHKLKPGSRVSIILPRNLGNAFDITAQNIPLDIIYEDEDLMIVNKQSGFAVHPGVGIPRGTLVNAVAWHLQESYKNLPVLSGNERNRAGLVHRIDKDTTGLMVVAKKELAMSHLANQFFYHTIERKYVALVWGNVEEDSGTIVTNIGRNPNDRRVFMAFPEGDYGKHAVTHYKVLERFYYTTLVECQLETGRTHQIRVHMKYLGHTLFSDHRYGGNHILKGTVHSKYKQFVNNQFAICGRQALHAKVLGFTHPTTGEHMRFELGPPEDMATCIDRWRDYIAERKSKGNL